APGGESERVAKPVLGLDEPLREEAVRRVAGIAGRDRAMARLHPAIELLAHHVTVHAGLGIVDQVAVTARVDEGVASDPDGRAQQGAQDHAGETCAAHRPATLAPPRMGRRSDLRERLARHAKFARSLAHWQSWHPSLEH